MPSAATCPPTFADRELLDDALRRLEPEWRAVVVLHYFLGMPLPEVAVATADPVGTVKSRLHRSLGVRARSRRPGSDGRGRPGRAVRMTSVDRFENRLPAILDDLAAADARLLRRHLRPAAARGSDPAGPSLKGGFP